MSQEHPAGTLISTKVKSTWLDRILQKPHALWFIATFYFLSYIPYSALTKLSSDGAFSESGDRLSGLAILPLATLASLAVMLLFLFGTGWWRYAHQKTVAWRSFSLTVPVPSLHTVLSGLCTAVILTMATLAFSVEGVPIVFMMLMLRGGVLFLAPLVDLITGRRPRRSAWIALGASLVALILAAADRLAVGMSASAFIVIALYLGAYFIRFQVMNRNAKTNDPEKTKRYFAEEQLIAAPASLLAMAALAAFGPTAVASELNTGFSLVTTPAIFFPLVTIGIFSQFTGIFGTLVLLDHREHSFSVPVNRAASVIAALAASSLLAAMGHAHYPSPLELVAATILVATIAMLSRAG
jgi:hypothetical protein